MRAVAGAFLPCFVWALILCACGSAKGPRISSQLGETISGVTTAGIEWQAPVWATVAVARMECEINEAAGSERSFGVCALPGLYTLNGVRVAGHTDIQFRRVYAAWDTINNPSVLPALHHEFNHVRLWRLNGNPDAGHVDASWATLLPIVCGTH